MSEEYVVGYGRPPKERQFTKGQSGNPAGRPRGSKSIATMFNQITRELINIKENGRTKTVTRLEAVLHRMTNEALSGNPRVMREFVQLSRAFEEVERIDEGQAVTSEREAVVLGNLMKRMKRINESGQSSNALVPAANEEQE